MRQSDQKPLISLSTDGLNHDVPQVPVGNVVYLLSGPSCTDKLDGFHTKPVYIMSYLHIIVGICCMVLNIVTIVLNPRYERLGQGKLGWVFFIVTGAFGFWASRSIKKCAIITFMVLSILSSIVSAFCVITLSGILIVYDVAGEIPYDFEYDKKLLAIDLLLISFGFFEAILSIASAALCSRVACCCSSQMQMSRHTQAVIVGQGQPEFQQGQLNIQQGQINIQQGQPEYQQGQSQGQECQPACLSQPELQNGLQNNVKKRAMRQSSQKPLILLSTDVLNQDVQKGLAGNVVYLESRTSLGPSCKDKLNGFQTKPVNKLSYLHIIIGICCLVFNVAVKMVDPWCELVGGGIWGGLFFIVTGAFGFWASRSKTRSAIITFMVLSILSSIVAAFGVIILAYDVTGDFKYGKKLLAIHSRNIFFAFFEAILSIASAALCCRAACCCSSQMQMSGQVKIFTVGQGQPEFLQGQLNIQQNRPEKFQQHQQQGQPSQQACQCQPELQNGLTDNGL